MLCYTSGAFNDVIKYTMIITGTQSAVVSSTDLKRNYKDVQKLLKKNVVVIVVNRNSEDAADGIFFPYSEGAVERIEDLLEDIEMERNKAALVKEYEKSHSSGKGKRYR